jgi:hypothetical protein
MPEDFAVKLRVKELEMRVAFLAKQKSSAPISSDSDVD